MIHLHGLKNLRQSSTFTSSSDAASDYDTGNVTSLSSVYEQRRLGRKGRRIPARGLCSDPALDLDAAVSLPKLSAASVCTLSTSLTSPLSSSSASASVCLLPPLPSSSNPSRFLRHPTICPLVWPARYHHISINPESLPPLDFLHLYNILSIQPHPHPPSISHSSIFLCIYLSISPHSLSLSSLSHSLSVSLYIFNILVSRPFTHFITLYY